MPTTTLRQGLTLPVGTDVNNVPGAFTSYNTGVESRLVQRYSTAADRTVRDPAPVEGELSYLSSTGTVEVFKSGAWVDISRAAAVPTAGGSRTTNLSIPTGLGAATSVTLPVEDFDNAAMFTAGNAFMTIPFNGIYAIKAFITFQMNGTGIRQVEILVNPGATRYEAIAPANSSAVATVQITIDLSLTATQTVTMGCKQNSGVALNANPAYMSISMLSAL